MCVVSITISIINRRVKLKKLIDYFFKDHPYEKLDTLITDSVITREIDLSRPGSILGLTTREKEEACMLESYKRGL